MGSSGQQDRDVATLAVEGRETFDRRAVLAAAAAAAERAKYQKTDEDIEAEQQKSKNLVLGIAGVGTLASGAFIIPNLTRLGIKVASGGKDAGYETYANSKKGKGRGKAKPVFKEKSFGEKLFST